MYTPLFDTLTPLPHTRVQLPSDGDPVGTLKNHLAYLESKVSMAIRASPCAFVERIDCHPYLYVVDYTRNRVSPTVTYL